MTKDTYSIIVQDVVFKYKVPCIFAISIDANKSIFLQEGAHLQVSISKQFNKKPHRSIVARKTWHY